MQPRNARHTGGSSETLVEPSAELHYRTVIVSTLSRAELDLCAPAPPRTLAIAGGAGPLPPDAAGFRFAR